MTMHSRREFIGGSIAAAATGIAADCGAAAVAAPPFMRSALLHLSMSMWGEWTFPNEKRYPGYWYVRDHIPTEEKIWNATIDQMVRRKYNHAIIDVGDAVIFPSHPELAVKGSWTPERLRDEVRRLKKLGIEAIPKLNFSANHDGWLKQYGRMLSTRRYYEVVKDLINDTCEIFEGPRQFHLGLDEEETRHIFRKILVQVRRGDLWWHDFHYMIDLLEKQRAQPICFSMASYLEYSEKEYLEKMPKCVLQHISRYGIKFDTSDEDDIKNPTQKRAKMKNEAIRCMVKNGYSILAGTSAWKNLLPYREKKIPIPKGKDFPLYHESAKLFLAYIRREVPRDQLVGLVSMPWQAMTTEHSWCWESGIDELADALDAEG